MFPKVLSMMGRYKVQSFAQESGEGYKALQTANERIPEAIDGSLVHMSLSSCWYRCVCYFANKCGYRIYLGTSSSWQKEATIGY